MRRPRPRLRGRAGAGCATARFLDPNARFRSESKTVRLYFRIDGHWNAAGHRVVADILAQRILPFVEKQASPPPLTK